MDHPQSPCSPALCSRLTAARTNYISQSICCSNPSLHPPATHLRMTTLPSRTGQHPCLLLLPPLPSYFLWLPRRGRTEKGLKMLSAFETRGSGGVPYHRQSLHPRPLSLLQRGLAPRSKGKARAEPIRVFSNESALHIRWPTYWSFMLPSPEFPLTHTSSGNRAVCSLRA